MWEKIKSFFKRIFGYKEETLYLNSAKEEVLEDNNINFFDGLSVREELQKQNEKDSMAQKLLDYELSPTELNEKEVDDMIEWFKSDIEKTNNELEKVRKQILSLKLQLEG